MNKVKCIDSSARPESIPLSMWVIKDQTYTVIEVLVDMNQVEYYRLAEIDLSSLGTLYRGFASSRFTPLETKKDEVKEQDVMYV